MSPIKDPLTGRWITSHVMNQDFIAWVGQGTVADRTQEHLGESDRGVIMMRRRILEEAERRRRGGEPKARDPRPREEPLRRGCRSSAATYFLKGSSARSRRDRAPAAHPGLPLRREFPFLVGQPEEVRAAYRRAMGLLEPGVDARSDAG